MQSFSVYCTGLLCLAFIFVFQEVHPESVNPADSVSEKTIKSDSILHYARKFLGVPYQKGGKGPKRFDCSGYTGYVFSKFGYTLAANSASQYLQGKPVELDSLRKGDLVFFKGRNVKSQGVGHVGIVYETDTANCSFRFIHAAVQGGVRIDYYPGGTGRNYYDNRYIGAKRILPAASSNEERGEPYSNPEIPQEVSQKETPQKEKTEMKNHIVKEGDTLYSLARFYSCTVADLQQWNNLKTTNIKVGQNLKIY